MKIFVLIDLSNGHKNSRNYLWWFKTKKEAKEYRKFHKTLENAAKLSKPIKVKVGDDFKSYTQQIWG